MWVVTHVVTVAGSARMENGDCAQAGNALELVLFCYVRFLRVFRWAGGGASVNLLSNAFGL